MQQIGKYTIEKELGRGGFGAVYLARDPKLGEHVAIKVFQIKDENLAKQATSATSEAGKVLHDRFLNEAKILRQLSSNPNIIDVYDFDEVEDGTPYYVMPYLSKSLVDEIGKDALTTAALEDIPAEVHPRRLPVQRSTQILGQLLNGLAAVHKASLVHRDIKPANVLFDPQGQSQLCDFGIAKTPDVEQSQTGLAMGSRNYMSPEQRESAKHVGAQSDIYSFGVLAYRMLTGTLPEAARWEAPLSFSPNIGQSLNDLILKCMENDPSKRPQDAIVLQGLFKQALQDIDENAPELSDDTSTDIGQAPQQVRDQLKPLTEQIETLLLEQGELTQDQHKQLIMMGDIVDLDEAGLDTLIAQVTQRLSAQLKPLIKIKKQIDTALTEYEGVLPETMITNLKQVGQLAGIENEHVEQLISQREELYQHTDNSAELEENIEETDNTEKVITQSLHTDSLELAVNSQQDIKQEKRSGIGVFILLAVLLVGGWQYYEYEQGQQAIAEAKQSESKAWEQAQEVSSIDSYELYMKLWPQGEHHAQAQTILNKLKEQQRLAQLSEAEKHRELIKEAQVYLNRLGFAVPNDGVLDKSTESAVKAFEQQHKFIQTGHVDNGLLVKLKKAYRDADDQAWSDAQTTQTEQGYRAYLKDFKQGEYIKEVELALAQLLDAEQAKIEREKVLAQQQAEKEKQQQHAQQTALVKQAQQLLNAINYRVGTADGKVGAKTTSTIKRFQQSIGQVQTGEVDEQLITQLEQAKQRYLTEQAQREEEQRKAEVAVQKAKAEKKVTEATRQVEAEKLSESNKVREAAIKAEAQKLFEAEKARQVIERAKVEQLAIEEKVKNQEIEACALAGDQRATMTLRYNAREGGCFCNSARCNYKKGTMCYKISNKVKQECLIEKGWTLEDVQTVTAETE